MLLRSRSDFYASRHAGPADVLLVVEVAESSFDYDYDVKASLYARLNLPEYWLVDLNENVLYCHSSPERGSYRTVRQYQRGQSLAPQLLPNCVVQTNDLIPE